MLKKWGRHTHRTSVGEKQKNSVVTCQTLGRKHKEPGLLLRSLKCEVNMSCEDKNIVSGTSMQTIQLGAQKSLTVIKTKIKLHSHADNCVVDD